MAPRRDCGARSFAGRSGAWSGGSRRLSSMRGRSTRPALGQHEGSRLMPRKARREVATRIKPTMTPMKPPVRRSRNGGARVGARVGAPAKGDGSDAAKKNREPTLSRAPGHGPALTQPRAAQRLPEAFIPLPRSIFARPRLRGAVGAARVFKRLETPGVAGRAAPDRALLAELPTHSNRARPE